MESRRCRSAPSLALAAPAASVHASRLWRSPAATLQACRDRSQRLCPPSIGASWSAALLLPRQKPRQTAASAHASGRRCGRNGAASRRQPRRQAPRARFFGAPEPQRRAAR
ncbi:hypothetical protein FA09DRAFT_332144 [Tilletiopsis washingtonensis]|uniref:Uncharacterized protein n=1 Tax=Tilletiopsis washingtonensis TaxID=58919 RepID=A0A316Z2B2_9BASI|nr:hypothetical protein FA09DRAFT_332144 [Tilletiopsis washingtonensis]PWN95506.1 hypothetical protein FA09DRAFT_332144 [Tilletiopsis washingtonensis]